MNSINWTIKIRAVELIFNSPYLLVISMLENKVKQNSPTIVKTRQKSSKNARN